MKTASEIPFPKPDELQVTEKRIEMAYDKYARYEKYFGKYDKWDESRFQWDENNMPNKCTQLQVRYSCGHTLGGEFIKCARHIASEDERCSNRYIHFIEAKQSTHKCRTCLRSA